MRRVTGHYTRCRFGVAVREITPPVGILHSNWGAAKHDVAEGVHRPLYVTASVMAPLDGGGPTLALVALDHISFLPLPEITAMRAEICERGGIEDANLLINCSHTHGSAIIGRGLDRPGAELLPVYRQKLIDGTGAALAEARAALAPAWITWGQGRCALAANRDYWDEARQRYVIGFNPLGEADDTLVVGRVTGDDGRTLATLFNYACHPTTLAWENRRLSPDYIGAAREVLNTAFGAPALFLQGASGELGAHEGQVGDTAVADRNGRQLGYAAAAAIEALPSAGQTFVYQGVVESGAPLGDWRYEPATEAELAGATVLARFDGWVPLARKPDLDEVSPEARSTPGAERAVAEKARRRAALTQALGKSDVYRMPIWCWRLGQAALVAIPMEAYSAFQLELRRRFAGTPLLVLGVTNTSVGYLSPADTYGQSRYQEQQSPFAAGCLEQTIDATAKGLATVLAER